MKEKIRYKYELYGTSAETGILFQDSETNMIYRLDEEKGELVGATSKNFGERIKIEKGTDIEPNVPYFKKEKYKMKDYDVYSNIKGERFIHDKEMGTFIGIDETNKNVMLHIKKREKMPVFVSALGHPLYIGRMKETEYPYAFAGTTVAGIMALEPLIEELSVINPPLSYILATTPALAGFVAEKIIRNKKLHEEIKKDIKKFERLIHAEIGKMKTWEREHLMKKLHEVI